MSLLRWTRYVAGCRATCVCGCGCVAVAVDVWLWLCGCVVVYVWLSLCLRGCVCGCGSRLDNRELTATTPQVFVKSLTWMLDNDITDIIHETFSVEEHHDGEEHTVELKPGGEHIDVTEVCCHEACTNPSGV